MPLLTALGFGALHPGLPWGESSTPSENEWVGVLHVHTELSDATGTLEEIAEVANREALDFVVVTDHNLFAFDASRYMRESLFILGEEATTSAGEHLLVIGGPDPLGRRGDPPELEVPRDPDAALRIVSHPFGPGRPWRSAYPPSIDAIEIWNADTELRSGDGVLDWSSAVGLLLTRPLAGLYRLLDRPSASLALLDSLQGRRMAGVCSVDAHQRLPIGDFDIRFPRYRQSFLFARMHVLLPDPPSGDAAIDSRAVVESLRAGRSYCGFDGLADARGFSFEIRSGDRRLVAGDDGSWGRESSAHIRLPAAGERARVTLYRDGAAVGEVEGAEAEFEVPGPGFYRVEVSLDLPRDGRAWLPWILSNGVYLGPEVGESGDL